MTKEEFVRRTDATIAELFRTTWEFIVEEINGKALAFSVVTPKIDATSPDEPVTFEEITTDREGFINHVWKQDTFSAEIRLFVHRAEADRVILRAFTSHLFIDESHEEWQARQSYSENVRAYLPYYLRLPRFPKGWRIRDERGIPDMETSLRLHGKYSLNQR